MPGERPRRKSEAIQKRYRYDTNSAAPVAVTGLTLRQRLRYNFAGEELQL